MEAHYPGAKLQMYPTMDALFADLKIGRIDIMFGGIDEAGDQKEGLIEIGTPVAVSEGIGMAFRPEDSGLRDEFNKALGELKADGTWRNFRTSGGSRSTISLSGA